MNFQPFAIAEIVDESEGIRTFKLASQTGSAPAYQPGHFFLLRLKDATGKMLQRSYSASSHPSEGGPWFCIKLKGEFTHLLWSLKKGDIIEVDGPYGIFLLRPDDTMRVFIGGGVGISALRSMILQTAKHDSQPCHLFHSAHTFDGLTYYKEMKELAEKSPGFRFHPSITGEEKPAGWEGLAERISVQALKNALGGLEGKTFYLCGSKEMAGSLAAALIAQGVPKDRVKKDEWG